MVRPLAQLHSNALAKNDSYGHAMPASRHDPLPMAKLHRLQALRGFAALAVVATHALTKLDRVAELSGRPATGWTLDGTFGVDIFFVISGFIMVHTTGAEFGRAGAPLRFLARRAWRIVPLYWLFTLIEFGLKVVRPEAAGAPAGPRELALSLAFIPYGLHDGIFRPVHQLGWTLDFEMAFYAVFALGLFLRPRYGLVLVAALLSGMVLAGTLGRPETATAVAWTSPILVEFLLGGALALGYRAMRARGVTLAVPAPLAIIAAVIVAENAVWLWLGGGEAALGWRPAQWIAATGIVAIAVLAPAPRPSGWGRALERLGDSSYSLYLCHPLVLTIAARVWMALVPDPRLALAFLPAALVACVAAGWVVHRVIERPLLRFAGRSVDRGRSIRRIDPSAFVSVGRTAPAA